MLVVVALGTAVGIPLGIHGLLGNAEELQLVRLVAWFPRVLRDAASQTNPAVLAAYLIEVARAFNKFHHDHSVLHTGDRALSAARMGLCDATAVVLREGLRILGIDAPDRM